MFAERAGRISLLLSCALVVIALPGLGQTFPKSKPPLPLPQDWSHSHVVFANGGAGSSAGRAARDPRNWHNWLARSKWLLSPAPRPSVISSLKSMHRDWAVSLGPTAGMPAGESPAKFSFDVNATPSCTNDFAVFPVAAPANAGVQANLVALNNLYSGSGGTCGAAVIGSSPAGAVRSSNVVTITTTTAHSFTVGMQVAVSGVTDATFNGIFTVTSVPSTTSFTYAQAGGNAGSGGGQASFATASVMWAYAVGTGPATGSPALSMDGTKVVFLENASNVILHVLTWVSGQGADATTGSVAPGSGGSSVTSLDYTASAAPGCSASPAQSSYGSPFVDYFSDVAYVGADNGILYRIKNVFTGTPAVDYCVTVSAGAKLTAPVFDPVSGNVFVSDGQSVYAFTPGASSFTANGQIQVAGTTGSIVRPVILDVSFGWVYAFSSHNVGNTNAIVSQMPVSLASKTDTAIGPVPSGAAPHNRIYEGAFDNAYFATGPATGSLYACGTQSAAAAKRALYRITFAAGGAMNTTPAVSNDINLDSASVPATTCAPAVEFFDGSKDRLFLGAGGTLGLATDVVTSSDKPAGGTTLTTNTFSTSSGNELLLAFISSDQLSGGAGTVLVSGVSGAGLPWTLVKRSNGQLGTAEIWRAFASSALSNQSVTVTLTQAADATVTVVSFTGIDVSGFSPGSNAIGATVAANAATGAPAASLTSTRDHSWTFGAGNDPSSATTRTLGPNQALVHEFPSTIDMWLQRQNATTLLSGTSVTINDTAPTTDAWNLALIEVLPALGADRMTMWDITTPIASSSTSATQIAPNQLGGTSGAIVDNNSAAGQAASVYFGTLDTGSAASCGAGMYCAVKLTQSGLQ